MQNWNLTEFLRRQAVFIFFLFVSLSALSVYIVMKRQLHVVSGKVVNQKQLRFIPRNLPAANLSAHLVATAVNAGVWETSRAEQANCAIFTAFPFAKN